MVQDKELRGILDKLAESLIKVYGNKLKSVILYGSAARGTNTPESDIDIMILVLPFYRNVANEGVVLYAA